MKIALMLALLLLLTTPADATVFWDDDFESPQQFNGPGGWGEISQCGSTVTFPEGCNPTRVTHDAHSGTHSLNSHYQFSCGMVDGTSGCGTSLLKSHAQTKNVYMRWWSKHVCPQPVATDTCINTIAGSKQMYNKTNDPNTTLIFWHIFQHSNFLSAQFTHNIYSAPCPQFGNGTGNSPGCNLYGNQTLTNLIDGSYHCIETHVSLGTPGIGDGLAEAWVDGVLALSYTGLYLNSPGPDIIRWDTVDHFAQLGNGDRYVDQIAVGDARIGCGSTPPPPSPNAPTSLRLISWLQQIWAWLVVGPRYA